MDHRYGRHGPHAWLSWRRHRYAHPSLSLQTVPVVPVLSSVPVESATVIRIFVPADRGRMIYIIMSDNDKFSIEQEKTGQEVQIIPGSVVSGSFVPSPPQQTNGRSQEWNDTILSNKVSFQALKDASAIQEASEEEAFTVFINSKNVERIINAVVMKYFEENDGQTFYDLNEYQKIIDVQKAKYMHQLKTLINSRSGTIKILDQSWEVALRELARVDKEQASLDYSQSYHIRDLAVIRVLDQLGFNVEEAYKQLKIINERADAYQLHYSKPGKEKIWPDQDYFRNK